MRRRAGPVVGIFVLCAPWAIQRDVTLRTRLDHHQTNRATPSRCVCAPVFVCAANIIKPGAIPLYRQTRHSIKLVCMFKLCLLQHKRAAALGSTHDQSGSLLKYTVCICIVHTRKRKESEASKSDARRLRICIALVVYTLTLN
jgi:hypothetical protein